VSWKLDKDERGFPVLLAATEAPPAPPQSKNGGDPAKETDGPELTAESREYIDHIKSQNDGLEEVGVKHGESSSEVKLKNSQTTVIVPVAHEDSPDEVKDEMRATLAKARATRYTPRDVPHEEWQRRQDAVRDAAREIDRMSEGDAVDFVRGRALEPDKVDIKQFLADVHQHRLDDLTDIFDYSLRSRVEGMMRSRRYVRLVAPKGWTQRVFGSLSDDDIVLLTRRLERRGWKQEALLKHVVGRIMDENRRATLEALVKGEPVPERPDPGKEQ
jgi:hypothetical protein